MTGACWDVLVALFRGAARADRAAALAAAARRAVDARGRGRGDGADRRGLLRARRAPNRPRSGGRRAPRHGAAHRTRVFRPADDRQPGGSAGALPRRGRGGPGAARRRSRRRSRSSAPSRRASARSCRGTSSRSRCRRRRTRRASSAGRRRRDLFLHGPEYGPADGAAVEIADAFALAFGEQGFLRASRVHRAGAPRRGGRARLRPVPREAEPDRRRERRRAPTRPRSSAPATAMRWCAVPTAIRRLRRVWISRRKEQR